MRFKLDENLHCDAVQLLLDSGHDAMSLFEQGMSGHKDADIAQVCKAEDRVLLTQDLDFTDVRLYPPQDYPGIVVFRLSNQSWNAGLLPALRRLIPLLQPRNLTGCLWIVDDSRVRIRTGGDSSHAPSY